MNKALFHFETGRDLVLSACMIPPPERRRSARPRLLLFLLAAALLGRSEAAPVRPGENLFTQEPTLSGVVAADDPKADRTRPTYVMERLGSAGSWRLTLPPPGARTGFVVRLPSGALPSIQPGQLVRISAQARGRLRAGAEVRGITLGMELQLDGDRKDHSFQATVPARPGRGGSGAFTGDFEWMPVEVVFAMPANVHGVEARFFSDRVHGQLEWKQPRIELVAAGKPTVAAPTALPTLTELAGARTKEEEERTAAAQARLGIPAPEQLYRPAAAIESGEPRLFFGGRPISEWRERWKDPSYEPILKEISRQTLEASGQLNENRLVEGGIIPQLARRTALFPIYALAALGAPDEATRTAAAGVLERLAPEVITDPPSDNYVQVSAQLFHLALTYDWLRDRAAPGVLAPLRIRIIEVARHLRSPLNEAAVRQRHGTDRLNPALLADRTALAAAAAALWTDTAPPLQAGEARGWMDEAVTWYSVVWRALPADGTAMEGFDAQGETLLPLMDFAAIADGLTTQAQSPLDLPALRSLPAASAAMLLPDRSGFVAFGPPSVAGDDPHLATLFRMLGTRHADPVATALADLLAAAPNEPPEEGKKLSRRQRRQLAENAQPNWRSLFWGVSTAAAAAPLPPLPPHADFPDLGISTVRGITTAGAEILFAVKCGSAYGKSAEALGEDFSEPRTEPDAGSFELWRGGLPVVAGVHGVSEKSSAPLALPLFLPTSADPDRPPVGQLPSTDGQGADIARSAPPRIVSLEHTPTHHTWLFDLGESFREREHRRLPLPPAAATQYLRRVVFLPRGVAVIADRIKPAEGRAVEFRIPIPAADARLESNGAAWTVGDGTARLVDWSPGRSQRTLEPERFNSMRGEVTRPMFRARAANQGTIVFAVAIGLDGAEKSISVSADPQRIRISGLPQGFVQFDWEK